MSKDLPKTATDLSLASKEKRLYAIAIDMLLLLFIAVLLPTTKSEFIFFLLQLAYFVGSWSFGKGQTIGNRLMKIRVVSVNGASLSMRQALIRYLGFLLSELVLFIGFLWMFKDKKRQGWHDKLAKTLVITT